MLREWRQARRERRDRTTALQPVLKSHGHCPTCDHDADFVASAPWLRDHYFCTHCGSIPRERALMRVIDAYCPGWREVTIHESSPGARGASLRLSQLCPNYIPSQYFPDNPLETLFNGIRNEDLANLSFPDESIDLHVTQDVLEHVFDPSRVFQEIARTLKPGGMHICTVPLINKSTPSRRRAEMTSNGIIYLEPANYHGNPVGDGRSLVTMDWGFDITRHIFEASGLFTQMIYIDDLTQGIRAEYIEVLVTQKLDASSVSP